MARLYCILFALTAISSAYAQDVDSFPPLSGWTHPTALADDTNQRHGVILSGALIDRSSPAVAEIDGNTANGLETAVGGADGILYVFRADGSLLWSRFLPSYGCSGAATRNRLLASPAVGELFGDGNRYVVIGYGNYGGNRCDGGVAAYRGSDGASLFTFSLKKFARRQRYGSAAFGFIATPALADTDGDGQMEIGFGALDRNVYLLNADGSVRWYYNAADTISSSPAFANVDDDNNLELIIGTDISKNTRLRPRTKDGGYLYAFKTKARARKHITFRNRSAYVWQTYFDQVIQSSPVVAELIPENPGQEIVIGAGCFFPRGSSNKNGRWLKILDLRSGRVLRTLDAAACMTSSPAVGDLDDDGSLEIVATINGAPELGGDGNSRITAWNPENPSALWSIIPKERTFNNQYGGSVMSPVIADLDGNGSLEVIAANNASVGVFNGRDGSALTCQDRSCSGKKLLFAWKILGSTPAVADVNLDGQLEVIIGGSHEHADRHGTVFAWTGFRGVLGSPAGGQAPFALAWPQYRGGATKGGVS